MRKLRLNIEGLAVESFETLPTPAERGTVEAFQETTTVLFTPKNICSGQYTACGDVSCAGGCTLGGGGSCDPACQSFPTVNVYVNTCQYDTCGTGGGTALCGTTYFTKCNCGGGDGGTSETYEFGCAATSA